MTNQTGKLRIFFLISGLGIFQFFVLTAICMFLYTGGDYNNPEVHHYSFLNNFFSDLGRTVTFNNVPNTPVYKIFSSTVIVAGLSTVLFCIAMARMLIDKKHKPQAYIGGFFGVVAGLCYVGVGLTPWDLFFQPHILFVKIGFLSFLLALLPFAVAMYKQADYPNFYVWVVGVFILILVVYLYLLFFGPNDPTIPWQLQLQVIAQKILLYSQMTAMLIQAYGAYQFNRSQALSA